MLKKIILLLTIIIFLILGFFIATFLSEEMVCTEMGCPCDNVETEIGCNNCENFNTIFYTGIINIGKSCDFKEIIICEDNIQTNKRYDKKTCKYELRFFSLK